MIPPTFDIHIDLVDRFESTRNQMYVTGHESNSVKPKRSKKLADHPWMIIRTNSDTKTVAREIQVNFDMRYYEEINHIQAFDMNSLIRTIGGAVGMILGFAVWKVPDLISRLNGKSNKWNKFFRFVKS